MSRRGGAVDNNNNNKNNNNNEQNNNKQILHEAAAIQRDTKAALSRIQRQATATQEVGATTLEELYRQRQQWERIQNGGMDRVEAALHNSHRLQNRLSRWTWQLGSGRAARRKALNLKQVADEQQDQRNKSQRERLINDSAAPSSVKTMKPEGTTVVITPHGKQKKSNSQRNNSSSFSSSSATKNSSSLLYGYDSSRSPTMNEDDDDDDDELRPALEKLAQTDEEINQELTAVEGQLDEILYMAQTLGQELQAQSMTLEVATDQMEDIRHQQRIVNHRAGMFLTGRARRNYLVE